eukprot:gnl/TRDRNA2_/TRDRNA2_43647_c0_seq1.p1 gnl/TRDRNA2_/TRDRNA2_43647_c0~~gnl/TRDRNA2_/TRDRNA2_43647_c0_seq1.p1  ORF type:complete len:372 (-),score=13.30 gnl/TRDRNA2_/TRDRNA2_43647_c0_seq1:182-1297(-)
MTTKPSFSVWRNVLCALVCFWMPRSSGLQFTGPGAQSKIIFVHIPKTAGTSLDRSLHELHRLTGVSVKGCGVTKNSLRSCLPAMNQTHKILSGEFVSTEFVDLMAEQQEQPNLIIPWTFLRNPILRSLSQIEQHKRNGRISALDVENILFGSSCLFHGTHFCRSLTNPEKCLGDPCNIFGSHQFHVLGQTKLPTVAKPGGSDVANQRMENNQIHVGITEYYNASLCLLLDEHLHMHRGMKQAFSKCCLKPDNDCPLIFQSNSHHSETDYWDMYLKKPKIRAAMLQHAREDCELYQHALAIFERRVRSLEERHQITLLPSSAKLSNWTCADWLADSVNMDALRSEQNQGSVEDLEDEGISQFAYPEESCRDA